MHSFNTKDSSLQIKFLSIFHNKRYTSRCLPIIYNTIRMKIKKKLCLPSDAVIPLASICGSFYVSAILQQRNIIPEKEKHKFCFG